MPLVGRRWVLQERAGAVCRAELRVVLRVGLGGRDRRRGGDRAREQPGDHRRVPCVSAHCAHRIAAPRRVPPPTVQRLRSAASWARSRSLGRLTSARVAKVSAWATSSSLRARLPRVAWTTCGAGARAPRTARPCAGCCGRRGGGSPVPGDRRWRCRRRGRAGTGPCPRRRGGCSGRTARAGGTCWSSLPGTPRSPSRPSWESGRGRAPRARAASAAAAGVDQGGQERADGPGERVGAALEAAVGVAEPWGVEPVLVRARGGGEPCQRVVFDLGIGVEQDGDVLDDALEPRIAGGAEPGVVAPEDHFGAARGRERGPAVIRAGVHDDEPRRRRRLRSSESSSAASSGRDRCSTITAAKLGDAPAGSPAHRDSARTGRNRVMAASTAVSSRRAESRTSNASSARRRAASGA